MQELNLFIENFINLSNTMSIFLLAGLLLAGILKQFINDNFISSHLGKNSFYSVIKATILGIPLPLCSCSVVPIASSLQKEGASKGAIQSFLISAPITGADSIGVNYSFFGIVFTIYRVLTSIFIAIITGLIQNIFDNKTKQDNKQETKQTSCCSTNCCSSENNTKKTSFSIKKSLSYSFNILLAEMSNSLLFGLIIGGLFMTFLPKDTLEPLFQNQFLTYIVVLVMAMPLYVCATSSLPIASALLLSGMSNGAVFIFLSAGPASNSVTMSIIMKILGKTSFFIYLSSISLFSILFGYIFDTYFAPLEILNANISSDNISLLDMLSSVIILSMVSFYSFKNLIKSKQ